MKVLYLIFLVFLLSCSKENIHSKIETIDLANAINSNFSEVPLSLIADSISYVQLQTNENYLIKSISKPREQIKIINNRIFISDKTQLLSFDIKGKFITKYGNIGNGPGEYVDIRDFSILEKDKQVVIYSPGNQKIYFYKFNGDFIKSETINFWPLNISSINNTSSLVFANPKGRRDKTNYNALTFYDIIDKNIKRALSFSFEKNKNIAMSSNQMLYHINESLYFWEFRYDTIWNINNKEVKPIYYINYNNKMPMKYLLEGYVENFEEQNNYNRLWDFVENSSFIFFNFGIGKKLNHIFYNKKTKEQYNLRFNKLNSNGYNFSFKNDIDDGVPFWPTGITNNDALFSIIYPHHLLFSIDTLKTKNSNFSRIYHSIKAEDNPIIMIVYPKK